MTHFVIERAGDVDLAFDGECLIDVSSRKPGQDYWTEIRIYRTDSGKYVSEHVGCSALGERDRRNVQVVDDPAQLREALKRRKKAPGETVAKPAYLTDFALSVLEDAADIDPAIAAALEERI